MTRQEAIDYLARFLKPDLLALIVAALTNGNTPGRHSEPRHAVSYQEAQRLKLCPACGATGIPYGDDERKDPDFEAYQCPELHIFYVERKRP